MACCFSWAVHVVDLACLPLAADGKSFTAETKQGACFAPSSVPTAGVVCDPTMSSSCSAPCCVRVLAAERCALAAQFVRFLLCPDALSLDVVGKLRGIWLCAGEYTSVFAATAMDGDMLRTLRAAALSLMLSVGSKP
jgi:hypothetical protein